MYLRHIFFRNFQP